MKLSLATGISLHVGGLYTVTDWAMIRASYGHPMYACWCRIVSSSAGTSNMIVAQCNILISILSQQL